MYKLVEEEYQLQIGEPYWIPEVGLAIGRGRGLIGGLNRELLSWFDAQGQRYLSGEEKLGQVQTQLQQTEAQVQVERQARLAAIAQLHQMGLTPE